jgi:uncharacterized protein YndB with AHSA1/START domain
MPDSIEVVQQIDAPRARLWAALSEAKHLQNWQADQAKGKLDRGRIRLAWPALGVETELVVVDSQPERRLVLASGRSSVTFQLEPDALHLTHDGLEDADERDGLQSSWLVALKVLEHYVTRHFDTPRTAHWAVTPAQSTAAAAHVFFSDQHALNAWLTKHGTGIGVADSRCQLALRWGEQLSGRVLANTPGRDLAITWEERNDSVFVFRTLPSPLAPDERILALCWSHWECLHDDDGTRRHFEAALAGLQQLLANRGVA